MLGIFTEQGAQWPGMLKNLILGIPYTTRLIEELDAALRALPEKYQPSWTLASFSRPLCCAVRIVLVRLLSAAGI